VTTPLQAERHHCHPLLIPENCQGSDQTDLIPILRTELISRFFDDSTAFSLLGEVGRGQNRINVTIGFPLCAGSQLKFGGELLNQQLSYHFPYDHAKAWTRQYAAGGGFRQELDFWGFKYFDFTGQWSNAQNHHLHKYHTKQGLRRPLRAQRASPREPVFHRYIGGSKAYALTAGLGIEPWYFGSLGAALTFDKIDYQRKHFTDKVVSGFGGAIYFEQRFSLSVNLRLKGEFRAPYTYYEGSLDWRTTLCYTDVVIGVFGGHTQGRHTLPSSTIAGIEIGFDFGLSDFSLSRSVGLCDQPMTPSCAPWGTQNRNYLQWVAMPAVYLPEVLAIAEQYRILHCQHSQRTSSCQRH
jgi:hypothetical protein